MKNTTKRTINKVALGAEGIALVLGAAYLGIIGVINLACAFSKDDVYTELSIKIKDRKED